MASTRSASSIAAGTTREEALASFGEEVVGAMDELAALIFASRLLVLAIGDPSRAPSKEVERLATKIERALKAVQADLLEAVQLGARETLGERLKQARKANALRLAEAGMDAANLAALGGEALEDAPAGVALSPALAVQQRIEWVVAGWATL